jgi:hypothetical protein
MAGALGYHSTDPDGGARLCFHLTPDSYDTAGLIEVLEQMRAFCRGERVVLVWDGLSAHWSRAMRAWVAEQDWLIWLADALDGQMRSLPVRRRTQPGTPMAHRR